jgi:hypothetical protein
VDKTTLEVVSMSKVDDRDVRTRAEVGVIVPLDTPVCCIRLEVSRSCVDVGCINEIASLVAPVIVLVLSTTVVEDGMKMVVVLGLSTGRVEDGMNMVLGLLLCTGEDGALSSGVVEDGRMDVVASTII